MRIGLALNMYHYKVRVLNAKFDIDQPNCMVIGDPCFHGVRLQPCSQPKCIKEEKKIGETFNHIQNINNSISLCIPEYSECVVKNIYWNTNGEKTFTKSGKECQKWPANRTDITTGIGSHNMCRNPDDSPGGVWCYTDLSHNKISREYCYSAIREYNISGETALTYSDASTFCAEKEGHICSSQDIMSYYKKPAFEDDQWVAVSDQTGDYIQLGTSSWPFGELHSKIQGGEHGLPAWGNNTEMTKFRKKHVCCFDFRKDGE